MWRIVMRDCLRGAAAARAEREYSGRETKGGASVNCLPEQYRAEILAYQRSYLNDPTGIRSAGDLAAGAEECRRRRPLCRVRALQRQGADGAYTGVREHLAIFLAGKLDQMGVTREQCKDAATSRFPSWSG
jgi:hypothetical protein